MKMSDKEFDNLIKETMRWEADCIMKEVESAPEMKDVVAPEGMYDEFKQKYLGKKPKQAKKEQEKEPHRRLSPEEQELIRLGMKYRKNHGKGKYFILVAAIVCALGVGTISIGGKEKVAQEVKNMFDGKKQINIDSDGERTEEVKEISEVEVYEEIDEKFGFYPVQMHYLPDGMEFVDYAIEKDTQNARLHYKGDDGASLSYNIVTNHRDGSTGIDVEDSLVKEYDKTKDGISVKVQEFYVQKNDTSKWLISFNDQDVQCWLLVMGIDEQEINKIIDNLHFN